MQIEYNNSNQFYSQKKEVQKLNFVNAVIPVTISQILKLKHDTEIQNQMFQHLVIIARLSKFKIQNSRYKFLFVDSTQSIQIHSPIAGQKKSGFLENLDIQNKIGKYFLVALTPRIKQTERNYFMDMMREIQDLNEITKHHSDVIISHLHRKKNI